jgi:glycosyltransferase involved in cell wall biosynthesis
VTTARSRVVHLTSVHPPDDARIFFKECRALAAAGYEVHLVAPGATDSTRDGVRLHGLRRGSGRLRRMTSTVLDAYRVARSLRADIYHLHDPELVPAGLLLRARGAQVIYDVHEHLPQQILSKPWVHARLRRGLAALADAGERTAVRQLSAVVAAEPHIHERLARSARRAVTVMNYPALEEFEPVAGSWREKANEVCYVGALTEIRGAREMVRAIARTSGTLSLAGDFSPPELRDQLACEPGWRQVVALGRVDRPAVAATMARARAGLVVLKPVPKYLEATATKLFEYMAAEIPVIASDFPAWRAIVDRHECGVCVDPDDPRAIGAAIQRMLDDPETGRRMGENGRRAVERLYSWDGQREKLLALYEELESEARAG